MALRCTCKGWKPHARCVAVPCGAVEPGGEVPAGALAARVAADPRSC